MSINNSSLNTGIQQLRGLAALAVVFCHYGSDFKNYQKISKIFYQGQLGIHVFFFISGYIILYSLLKNKYTTAKFFRFMLKRSLRIDPVYIVTIILTLLTFWALNQMPSFKGQSIPFIPEQFFSHVLYIVPFTNWEFYNHVFWTLGIEFQFYLLIGIGYFLSNSTIYRVIFLTLFSLSIFIDVPKPYYMLTSYAPIFAMGMATLHFKNEMSKIYLISIILSAVIILTKLGPLILILLIITGLLVVYSNKTVKPLLFLGNISYSLYIIHPLVLIYILGISKRFGISSSNELINFIFQVSIAIGAAYLLFLLVERPSIKFSKKISYQNNE